MNERSHKRNFSNYPLLAIAIAFAFGITAASFFQFSIAGITFVCFFIAISAYALREQITATYLLISLFFGIGSLSFQFEKISISETRIRRLYDERQLISGEPIEIEGVVAKALEPAPNGFFILLDTTSATVKVSAIPVSGRVRLFVPISNIEATKDLSDLHLGYGSRIRVACLLEREDKFLNPGVYSRKLLLDRQQIDATANLKSPLLIEKVSDGRLLDRFIGTVFDLRVKAIQQTRELFSKETAGVLVASMFGNKYFLDKTTADVFREGGTFHVLVISGLHITFIGGLILLFVRRFSSRRWIQAIVTLSVLWTYGLGVGGEVPVMRACVMFSFLMIAYVEFRTLNLLNALGLAALLLLAWRPSDLFDPSFQLTFISVFAIIAIGLPMISKTKSIGTWMPSHEHPFPPNVSDRLRKMCESIYWNDAKWTVEQSRQIWSAKIIKKPYFDRAFALGIQNVLIFIFESVVVSVSVQISLLPLLVYYFHRFPLISIPLNLWVGGILAAESFGAVAALLVTVISSTLAAPFVALTEFFSWLIVDVPSLFTHLIGTGVRIPIYSGPARSIYLLYFLPLLGLVILLIRWDPFKMTRETESRISRCVRIASFPLLAILISFILLHPFSAPGADGKLHVEFLDVGQGDAAFVTFPNGRNMLIDAGGQINYKQTDEEVVDGFEPDVPRIGEIVVSEFLWERGISHIDTIVATHADADHIQGLEDVVKNFSIGHAFFGRLDNDSELQPLLTELERYGVPKTITKAGDRVEIGGVRVDVLNPFENIRTANNDSVVLRVSFGETTFLFTGDIEREAENVLVNSNDPLSANVIKVPHHGSRSSSTHEFVDAVSPRFAVISVGRNSVFRHPHKEVVERWRASGSTVITTGERGAITFVSDGKDLTVSRFLDQTQ